MALSDKKRLAKLQKKKQKRKVKLLNKKRSPNHINTYQQDHFTQDERPISFNASEKKDINHLTGNYDIFEDDDYVDMENYDDICPVHTILACVSDYIHELGHELEISYDFDISRFNHLCIVVYAWNLAKEKSLDIKELAADLEDEFNADGNELDYFDIIEALESTRDKIINNDNNKAAPVVITELFLMRMRPDDLGGILVKLKVLQGHKEKLLEKAKSDSI